MGVSPPGRLIKVYLTSLYAYQACFFPICYLIERSAQRLLLKLPDLADPLLREPVKMLLRKLHSHLPKQNCIKPSRCFFRASQRWKSILHSILHGTLPLVPTRFVQLSTSWYLPGTRYYFSTCLARFPSGVFPKMFLQNEGHRLDGERNRKRRRG